MGASGGGMMCMVCETWAAMEVATTKLADKLWKAQESEEPLDGVLGFSQGAEMVHIIALLKHQLDPRFQGLVSPSFVISLSGAVNPTHFESISGGGPPQDLSELYFGPGPRELLALLSKMSCASLFLYLYILCSCLKRPRLFGIERLILYTRSNGPKGGSAVPIRW